MEHQNMQTTVLCPSFEVERRTGAFGKYIWGPVFLISMFTVSLGVGVYHLCFSDLLNLAGSFIGDHFMVFMLLPAALFLVFSYQLGQWIFSLLTSYKFENGKIIRGRLQPSRGGRLGSVGRAVASYSLRNASRSSRRTISDGMDDIGGIIEAVGLNTDPEFVNSFFDTETYHKKVFTNPRWVKETKYSYIYTCDNKKRLVIPKIYEGMCKAEEKQAPKFLWRVLLMSAIVFVVAFTAASVDMFVSYGRGDVYMSQIHSTIDPIVEKMEGYGYSLKSTRKTRYELSRKVTGGGYRSSYVIYTLDKRGNIKNVEIQLYYSASSPHVAEELAYIIGTVNDTFDPAEVDEFIAKVLANFTGKRTYGTLRAEDYKLTLGYSDSFLDIHSYDFEK